MVCLDRGGPPRINVTGENGSRIGRQDPTTAVETRIGRGSEQENLHRVSRMGPMARGMIIPRAADTPEERFVEGLSLFAALTTRRH